MTTHTKHRAIKAYLAERAARPHTRETMKTTTYIVADAHTETEIEAPDPLQAAQIWLDTGDWSHGKPGALVDLSVWLASEPREDRVIFDISVHLPETAGSEREEAGR